MSTLPHSAGRPAPRPRASSSDTLLERLKKLHPQSIDLSLGRIERLLAALGHPEQKLPPVVHVAGTNGKGSFLAFLRATAEGMDKGVHVYTSPHLVSFHERILLAGPHGASTIGEDYLVDCLARAEIANGGELITLFEITTAAAFLAFSEVPAPLSKSGFVWAEAKGAKSRSWLGLSSSVLTCWTATEVNSSPKSMSSRLKGFSDI